MVSEPCPFSAKCYVRFGINEHRILKDGKREEIWNWKKEILEFGKKISLDLSQHFPKKKGAASTSTESIDF